VKINYTTFKA